MIGAVLFVSAVAAAAYWKLERGLTPRVDERKARVAAAAEAPGAPAWAGIYADDGGNHGAEDVLILSTAGYSHRGNYMSSRSEYGSVEASRNGVLLLRPAGWGRAKTLRLIPWDDRVYAIFDEQKLEFVNNVNKRLEPDGRLYVWQMPYKAPAGRHGGFGKTERIAASLPQTPDDWRPFLLDHPVEAAITKVGPVRYARDIYPRRIGVELDAGRNRGLVPGLRLRVKNFGSSTEIVLTSVAENSSSGEAWQGDAASTFESQRLPWVGEKAFSYAIYGDIWERR